MKQNESRAHRWTRVGIVAAALVLAPAAVQAQTAPAASTAASAADPAPVRTVGLDEAVRLAQAANPQVVSATGAVTSAQAAQRTARGAFLPSLSANVGTSLAGSDIIGATPSGTTLQSSADSYSAGLSASYDLYTGGRRGAEKTAADASARSARAGLVAQQASASLAVQQGFYDVLRSEDLTEVAQSRIGRAQEGLTAAQQRLALGSATRSDVLRAQLELNTARSGLLEAETNRDAARLQLGRLVGADEPVGARRGSESEVRPLSDADASALIAAIESTSPAITAAQAATQSAAAGVDAARSQYLPSLRVTTGYNWSNQDPALDQSRTSWSVGLGVSYPIFTGYQRGEQVARAQVQQTSAQASLNDALRGVRTDAARALGQLRLAEQRIDLAAQALETAQEDLRVQRERYRLGSSTILDLLTSQEALVQAESDAVTSRYDYQVARAQLEALAGRTL